VSRALTARLTKGIFCDYLFRIVVNGFILHFLRNTNIPLPTKNRFLYRFKKKRTSIESDEVDSYLSEGTGELSS
jgi:hypothetical protein